MFYGSSDGTYVYLMYALLKKKSSEEGDIGICGVTVLMFF